MSGYGLWKKDGSGLPGVTWISILPHHYPLHWIMEPSPAVGGWQESHKECQSHVDNQNMCVSSRWVHEDRRNKPAGDGRQDDAW